MIEIYCATLCQLVSGRDPSSRGRGATGSKAWTALVTISSVSAGHGAGWWWKTLSWCIWTETTGELTLCCCLTLSLKWKWAVLTQTPNTESALRILLGRSAVCLPTHWEYIAYIYAWGYVMFVIHAYLFFFCSGVWSSNAAAIDRLIGGVMKSTGWQKPLTFSKCSASRGLLRHGRTPSLNGQIRSLPGVNSLLSSDFILIC